MPESRRQCHLGHGGEETAVQMTGLGQVGTGVWTAVHDEAAIMRAETMVRDTVPTKPRLIVNEGIDEASRDSARSSTSHPSGRSLAQRI